MRITGSSPGTPSGDGEDARAAPRSALDRTAGGRAEAIDAFDDVRVGMAVSWAGAAGPNDPTAARQRSAQPDVRPGIGPVWAGTGRGTSPRTQRLRPASFAR
jgi:hypothetical protein